jgi:hypothetical protein
MAYPLLVTVEGSSSFLKKRTKKLFILGARAGRTAGANGQKFFASFFQKRRSCLMLYCQGSPPERSSGIFVPPISNSVPATRHQPCRAIARLPPAG